MKLADHLLATPVGIQDLTEESPEGVLLGENPLAAHRPILCRLEQFAGNKRVKNLSDLFEGFLLEQSDFLGKFLLGGMGFSTSTMQVKSWEHWHGILYVLH
ncbi:MAG: hypothetical protein M8357_08055 [Desulfobulbaceae bacterium]|nr:hypothetical protein [Desulfobulbaceae bacterium]